MLALLGGMLRRLVCFLFCFLFLVCTAASMVRLYHWSKVE